MTKAIGYVRVSTQEQATHGYSLDAQTILRTNLSRDGAVGAKLVEIRVRFNRGKV